MDTNVLDWLEVTAAACPDKPAFLDEDGAVTFADVRREARIIGTAAARLRAGRKAPIAVMSGRNAHTPAVFLGAVYAGCCYAPMDGTMPVHRLNSILHTLDTDLMIVQRAFYDKARTLEFSGEILIAEDLLEGCEDAALLADCRACARELDPLYIIFTSGSTGTPKGVITAQHSLMCYIEDYAGVMGIAREDVLGNQSPLDYIAAVRDIYLPLRFGATTAIIPKELFMSPERLFEYMNDKGVTAVGWSVSALTVPAALGAFECSVPQHLRKVCFSGSVMPCSCLRQWQLALPQARFVNQYGPTEATASCTYYVVPGLVEDTDVLPIGKPYPHYEVFLLSEQNEAVPTARSARSASRGPSSRSATTTAAKRPPRASCKTRSTARMTSASTRPATSGTSRPTATSCSMAARTGRSSTSVTAWSSARSTSPRRRCPAWRRPARSTIRSTSRSGCFTPART